LHRQNVAIIFFAKLIFSDRIGDVGEDADFVGESDHARQGPFRGRPSSSSPRFSFEIFIGAIQRHIAFTKFLQNYRQNEFRPHFRTATFRDEADGVLENPENPGFCVFSDASTAPTCAEISAFEGSKPSGVFEHTIVFVSKSYCSKIRSKMILAIILPTSPLEVR